LVGLRGAGKTTLGDALAAELRVRSSNSTARSSAKPASAFRKYSCFTVRTAIGASSAAVSSACWTRTPKW